MLLKSAVDIDRLRWLHFLKCSFSRELGHRFKQLLKKDNADIATTVKREKKRTTNDEKYQSSKFMYSKETMRIQHDMLIFMP